MSYLGQDIPKLGFGLMRLPALDTTDTLSGVTAVRDVDLEQTKAMVDLFLRNGFRYFDTCYDYIGGKSEEAVKTALIDRHPRESFCVATKLPAWSHEVRTAEDAKNMFFTSLRRTGAGYFDFYLLHNLGGDRTALYDKYGLWEFVREQKEKGLIRHIGFSWHDKADMLESVLTQHPDVEFVQLQINYADWESPSIESRKCYEVARRHNKPVVIMEPVKGGNLTRVPEQVRRIFADANPEPSLASWAIRFAASLDNVITVLSGMSTIEQMRDNVSYMGNFRPLDEDERIAVDRAREALAELSTIRCTACGYCSSGCPQHVGIPAILSAMNSFAQFGNLRAAKSRYARATCEGACIECGRCESVCPQHLEIRRHLKEAARLFE